MLFIALLSALMAAFCGYNLWKDLHERTKEQLAYEKLDDEVTLSERPIVSAQKGIKQDTETAIAVHDIYALQSCNDDCVGWIAIPDTTISYPVMYSPTEPERYLHLSFYNEYSYSGTPFLDARCSPFEGNMIIYGHNMINGAMFGSLKCFLSKEFLLNHRTICLELQNDVHFFEVVSVASVESNDPWYSFINPTNAVQLAETVAELRSRARINIGELPMEGERILTLSTCTGWTQSSRLIVVAKEMLL